MNGYIKYFENGGKNMSLLIKNNEVWEKYEEFWNVIKNKLNIKFHSQPIYENKYLKAKIREFDGNIKTSFGAIALSYPPFFIDDSGAEFHAD